MAVVPRVVCWSIAPASRIRWPTRRIPNWWVDPSPWSVTSHDTKTVFGRTSCLVSQPIHLESNQYQNLTSGPPAEYRVHSYANAVTVDGPVNCGIPLLVFHVRRPMTVGLIVGSTRTRRGPRCYRQIIACVAYPQGPRVQSNHHFPHTAGVLTYTTGPNARYSPGLVTLLK